MLSKTCKYGIRAAAYVALKASDGVKLSVKEIAKEVDAPEAFTGKILQLLNKQHIITSQKGPHGGFYVERFQLDQPIIHIVNAIDGMAIFQECGLGLRQCSEVHPCPMHATFKVAREALLDVFQSTTLGQLAGGVKDGSSYINNALGADW
ncbi:RrF2 family transcriptional regulator [Pontibacter akesuensis]|uniref:Transcriptional regulator, BadM/Rrf2 family n=1 Tax=Pontibacter akesuensis TaxID=388950 RepID=A0A1I7GGP3_9BACT|nr:Rrf2 family transcriptional regulator [Pontibacter akesuensis]GHA56991.1 hypothetical protein GCM10007389_05810 [Pontibacter akesuensis]SFU47481.1 transcriptional regulator, BadM/Rrf2 family [Pontibacter akesuensis]